MSFAFSDPCHNLVPLLRTAMIALALAGTIGASPVLAQEADATDAEATEAVEEEKHPPLLDLGTFQINDLRPMRNVTARLTFSMHLAFSQNLSEAQMEKLKLWKHRLRDQVITAIRIATIKDFQEPDLDRLTRIILIRVNRLFEKNLAEDVLFEEYLFRTH